MSAFANVAKRLRIPLGFVFGAAYLFLAPRFVTPLTLAVGAVVAFAGLLVRAWASGHIVKNDRLATTGPYAHSRNPLYFGSFLLAAGFAIAAKWYLLFVVGLFWLVIYKPTMDKERRNIRARFPEEYDQWEQNVPAFVPRPVPWRSAADVEPGGFSFPLYMKHGEWKAALVFVLALAYLAVRMRWPGV